MGSYAREEEHIPLAGYTALVGLFGAVFAPLLMLGVRHRRLPTRLRLGDVLLLGVATHKLTRILTRD